MDINAVKTVLAKHFDRYSTKTAVASQYLGGEYWLPKHAGSLSELLNEVMDEYDPHEPMPHPPKPFTSEEEL